MVNNLRPFFLYFGGKWRSAKRYPEPKHPTIIEPFAGAAGYSVRYPDRKVKLYDLDPIIVGIWDYLIKVSEKEILNLPSEVFIVEELNVCQEAKWLIGFWCGKGEVAPYKKPSSWMKSGKYPTQFWGDTIKQRISSQLRHIRHWTIEEISYENILLDDYGQNTTWFIDPPYQIAGTSYRKSGMNYFELSNWCQRISGQIIVCEQEGALWLPFKPFAEWSGTRNKPSKEVIWYKEH